MTQRIERLVSRHPQIIFCEADGQNEKLIIRVKPFDHLIYPTPVTGANILFSSRKRPVETDQPQWAHSPSETTKQFAEYPIQF
jgi:hypothetical protein